MKKLLLISALMFGCLSVTYGQSVDDVYQSFSSEYGANSVSLGKFATWMVKKFDRNLKHVKSIKVLSLVECNQSIREKFSKEATDLKPHGYEDLIRVNDNGEEVRVLMKVKNDTIKELLVLTLGNDPALVQLKGKLKLSDINKYINS